MPKKWGLALGSGGSRGIAHIGFLQALKEVGLSADFVTGCSIGAIVGALYAAGISPEEMKKVALSLRLSRIASLNFMPIKNNGLLNMKKAYKLMESIMGEKTFDELKIPFLCIATDLERGEVVELSEGNVISAALASSSIPGAFVPRPVGEYPQLVDGGILERVPTTQLKKMGAEVVIAVDVLGDLLIKKTQKNAISTLLRCIDIMDTRATQAKHGERAREIDLWLEPDLGGMDQYKVKNLDFAYRKGYELGVSNRDKIRELIGE